MKVNYRCIILISEPLRCEIAKSGKKCPKNNLIIDSPVKKSHSLPSKCLHYPIYALFFNLKASWKIKNISWKSPGFLLEFCFMKTVATLF